MTGSWRCFVAVPIDGPARTRLADAVATWRQRPDLAGLRWLDAGSFHLTLAFIGPTPPDTVAELGAQLATIANREPSRHALSELGGFPAPGRARVAWCGLADPDRRLTRLAQAVRRAVGLPSEEPYRPHVTLGRARSRPVDLRPWREEALVPDAVVGVDRVVLMRSHAEPGPGRYEPLIEVRLHEAVGV